MARRRKKTHPQPLRDIVARAYPSKEPADVKAIRAFAWWEKAVPARVAAAARPVRVERGILIVHAKNSVWAHELSYLEQELLERLQAVAPRAGIRGMKIRVGKLPPIPPPIRAAPPATPVVPVRELPEDLARALAAVGDDDVRGAVHEAASVALARDRK